MKPNTQPSDSTGLSALYQCPPRISSSSPVLATIVDLRPNPLICCSVFIPPPYSSLSEQLAVVESARRRILSDYNSAPIADALLANVHITKDNVSLYVFALGSTTEASPSQIALASLQLADIERECLYSVLCEGYSCVVCTVDLVHCTTRLLLLSGCLFPITRHWLRTLCPLR